MSNESSKARSRRLQEGYFEKYLVGEGIDIGCGPDPVTADCRTWDLPDGDAQEMAGLEPCFFDWVYSSHCLEHLRNPAEALQRWWQLVKPGGYMLVVVPDEDLYEQGNWPSGFNYDHKWTFTVHKTSSWSPVSLNLASLAADLPDHEIIWLRRLDTDYDYEGGIWDRTLGPAEAHIELLVRKQPG